MNRTLVTAGVLVGLFLAAIESTVVGTAMPTVIAHLGGVKLYGAVFTAYLLTSTVTVPLWGKLSDVYGRRGFYVAGLGIFIVGSALSGLSRSMPMLVAFRALQGIGAGAVMPLGFTIVGEIYSLEERARVQGWLSSVWGFASIVGPLIGGFLTEKVSWRAVFFVTVPFGIVAAAVVGTAYRVETPRRAAARDLDLAGSALLAGAATCLLIAPVFPPLAAAGLVLALVFVRVERHAPDPVLYLDLFRHRMFLATTVSGFFAGMAMFGIVSFVPLFVQAVIGTAATQAGAALTPFMLSWVVASTAAARAALRTGYRAMALAGTASVLAGAGLLAWLGPDATFWHVAIAMGFCGCGMGATFTPLLIAVQSAVPRERLGVATSAVQFFRSIGGAIGVGVLGAILAARLARGPLPPGVAPEQIVDPIARAALDPGVFHTVRDVLSAALHALFRAEFVAALAAFVATLLVPGGAARTHAREAAELHAPD